MAAKSADSVMAWYRSAIWRARILVTDRWMPDYVGPEHLAVVLLDPPANDLAELLKQCGLDPIVLRSGLVQACDDWVRGQGFELGFGWGSTGGGALTPRLKEAIRTLCPDGDDCDRCVFAASDLFVALVRVGSILRQVLGDDNAKLLEANELKASEGKRSE